MRIPADSNARAARRWEWKRVGKWMGNGNGCKDEKGFIFTLGRVSLPEK
jgi:hypothetical protein